MPFMMDIQAQRKADKGAAEVIQGLDLIVHKMLLRYERETGIRPRKIIYYRDGVGEGQFPEVIKSQFISLFCNSMIMFLLKVLHTEMLAIRKACSSLTDYDGGVYQPKITFITVQKVS